MPKHEPEFDKLCNNILGISDAIRFVGIIARMGTLVAGGMRKGVKSLEASTDSEKLYLEFALRNAMRHDFDSEFGKLVYAFSERERIKFATFPLREHIVLVSIEKERNHEKIIKSILEKLKE